MTSDVNLDTSFSAIADAQINNGKEALNIIVKYLPYATALHDWDRAFVYCRRIISHYEQRFEIPDQSRQILLDTLCAIIQTNDFSPHHAQRFLQTIEVLLKKRTCKSLHVNWRIFYDYLIRIYFHASDIHELSSSQAHALTSQLVRIVVSGRRYFDDNCVEEIWQHFTRHLNVSDSRSLESIALLALFLPIRTPKQVDDLVKLLPELYNLEALFVNSSRDFLLFCRLYARLSKYGIGKVSLLDRLPFIINSYIQNLDLQIAGQSCVSQHGASSPAIASINILIPHSDRTSDVLSSYVARILIHSLHLPANKQSASALSLLSKLLDDLKTYFHPSNNGKWTSSLSALIAELAAQYGKRVGKERRNEAKYDKTYYLTEDHSEIVSVLFPIAMQAIFAKSPGMVRSAEYCLRTLALIHPAAVCPKLLPPIYETLAEVSTPHRTFSLLQLLISASPSLFNRQKFPQGSAHLERILNACLPGIDPIDPLKTGLTLSVFSVIFAHVPFIDARKFERGNSSFDDAPYPAVTDETIQFPKPALAQSDMEYEESYDLDYEDEARSATFIFNEWSIAFLDAILKVVLTSDKYAKKNALDVYNAKVLGRAMRSFFNTLDITSFTSCLERLSREIYTVHTNAKKQLGIMISMLAYARPKVTLKQLVPTLLKRIGVTTANISATSVSHAPTNTIEWSLSMLAQAVKYAGGHDKDANALLEHVSALSQLIQATASHEDKQVRKMSNKLLRNLLHGLCGIYPTEWKNFEPSKWEDDGKHWRHWNTWGTFHPDRIAELDTEVDIHLVSTNWHTPTLQERNAASTLISSFLAKPLGVISAFGNTEDSTDSKTTNAPLDQALRAVYTVARGTAFLLGDIIGDRIQLDENDENALATDKELHELNGKRCPLVDAPKQRPIAPLILSIPSLSVETSASLTLRTYLIRILSELAKRIQSKYEGPSSDRPSLQTLSLLTKLTSFLLQNFGYNDEKVNQEVSQGRGIRSWVREHVSGYVFTSRPIFAQLIFDLFRVRYMEQYYSQPHIKEVDDLIKSLQWLSINDFDKVRSKAIPTLVAVLRRFPTSIDHTFSMMLRSVQNSSSTTEAVLGSITFFNNSTVRAWTLRNWRRLLMVFSTMCEFGSSHQDDKVQVAIQSYFSTVYPHLSPLKLSISFTEHAILTTSQLSTRNDAISHSNKNMLRTYVNLVSSLLKCAQNGSLHWRYQLMSSALLYSFILPINAPLDITSTLTVYETLVQFFVSALTNELASMQKVAIGAVAYILKLHKVALTSSLSTLEIEASAAEANTTSLEYPSVTPFQTESELISHRFKDFPYSGWMDSSTTVYSTYSHDSSTSNLHFYKKNTSSFAIFDSVTSFYDMKGYLLSTATIKKIEDFFRTNMDTIVKGLIQNHAILHPGVSAETTDSKSTGAGETIGKLAYSHFPRRKLPENRIPTASQAFDRTHVQLIEALVEIAPTFLSDDGALYKSLNDLVTQVTANGGSQEHEHENEVACTIAEILAGATRATTECSFTIQNDLQVRLLPLIQKVLQTAQPVAVTHYSAALRYIYHDTDPRRFAWLTRDLMLEMFGHLPLQTDVSSTDIDKRLSTSSSIQFKRIRFLLPLLLELQHNCQDICGWIVKTIIQDKWLESPYKQVRHGIAFVIFICSQNLFQVTKTIQSQSNHCQYQIQLDSAITEFLDVCKTKFVEYDQYLFHSSTSEAKVQDNDDSINSVQRPAVSFAHTVLTLMSMVLGQGIELPKFPFIYELFPFVIRSQHVVDFETAKFAKEVCTQLAWTSLHGAFYTYPEVKSSTQTAISPSTEAVFDVQTSISMILEKSQQMIHESFVTWHLKISVLKYLRIAIPRHAFCLTPQHSESLQKLIVNELLVDSQVEVREMATQTLISFITSVLSHPVSSPKFFHSSVSSSESITKLQSTFLKMMKTTATKTNTNVNANGNSSVQTRHAGVLGALALIASHPYDLPSNLPGLLASLAKYVNNPQPISSSIRKGFSEFIRTHTDEWTRFKLQFTDEQLEAVNDVNSAPSYFA